jgi:hypothetical protein
MPLYRLTDTSTGETEEHFLSWNALQEFLSENPTKQLLPAAPAIVSGVSGRLKPDEGFKDVLRNIKSKHRGSTIDVT